VPISITLRTIRDTLDANKPMDRDFFNKVVRMVACNISRLIVDEIYHFMDLKFFVSWYTCSIVGYIIVYLIK
jgi:hypothetical protein